MQLKFLNPIFHLENGTYSHRRPEQLSAFLFWVKKIP
jgi:hypothetical protein